MSSKGDRQLHARKLIQGKGKDVMEQRADRRQRLIRNFKSLRGQTMDSFRNLKDDEFTFELMCELKKEILASLDHGSLIPVEDVDEFLKDLDRELTIEEHERYEKLFNEEVEREEKRLQKLFNEKMGTLTLSHSLKCYICENRSAENGICDQCAQRHLMNQF